MALLVQTNLKIKKLLSIYLGWLILACAIKLGQINLLLWATVSSDFISGVIKELKPLQKDQDCCQLLRFYHSDDSGIYMDEM